eukprot:586289-Rhodomonas_salina.2
MSGPGSRQSSAPADSDRDSRVGLTLSQPPQALKVGPVPVRVQPGAQTMPTLKKVPGKSGQEFKKRP